MAYNEIINRKETMLFNREMRVKMVKSKKNETSTTDENSVAKYALVAETARKILKDAARVVALYIVLDTLRQVAVAQANRED